MEYVLGVDGGNSKTIALLAGLDGRIVGAGRGGCGDIYRSIEGAFAAVDDAVQAARIQSMCKAKRFIVAGAFSMAGADWPEDFALLRNQMRRRGYGRKIVVVNDAIGAQRAGCENGFGVAIAAGTGAATGARSLDGKHIWHSSFWQQGGAASMLGGEALNALYRAELGIGPATSLTAPVLAHFKIATVNELLHRYTGRTCQRPGPADKLARIVLDAAHAGDEAACEIVEIEARRLASTAIAAAQKVGFAPTDKFPLALIGSVFRHDCKLLAKAVGRDFKERFPFAKTTYSDLEPSAGALMLALEKAGVTVDETVRANIRQTLPPRSFFAT